MNQEVTEVPGQKQTAAGVGNASHTPMMQQRIPSMKNDPGTQSYAKYYALPTYASRMIGKIILNTLTEKMATGRERFLAAHPEIKTKIEALTRVHADAAGMPLDALQELETMGELRRVAHVQDIDPTLLFWSHVADTLDELERMTKVSDQTTPPLTTANHEIEL